MTSIRAKLLTRAVVVPALVIMGTAIVAWVVEWYCAATPEIRRRALSGNPGTMVFSLVFLPIIAGVLALSWQERLKTLRLESERVAASIRRVTIWAFVAGGIVSTAMLYGDTQTAVTKRVIEPIWWSSASRQVEFFTFDSTLRKAVTSKGMVHCSRSTGAVDTSELAITPFDCYQAFLFKTVAPVTTSKALLKQMNGVLWIQVALSFWAGLVGAAIAAVFIVLGIRQKLDDDFLDRLFVCLGLITAWFPLRYFSDWNINFGSTPPVETAVFYQVIILASTMMLVIFVMRKRLAGPQAIAGIVAAFSVVSAVIAKTSPGVLHFLAEILDRADPLPLGIAVALLPVFLVILVIGRPAPAEGAAAGHEVVVKFTPRGEVAATEVREVK